MWTKIKWGLRILLLLIVVGFLHYTLPDRDIVRINDTYNRVTQIGGNWMFYALEDTGTGAEGAVSRDIRFIEAVFPDGETVVVYRNEDTGWLWPPYFKYDSSNLQAEATNLRSTRTDPQWVAITHYGWRLPIISVFPNAVAIRPVAGPDVQLIPWVNIVILSLLAAGIFMIRRMWLQFRERTIDPALAEVGDSWNAVDAKADAARAASRGYLARIRAWFSTWRARR